MDATKTQPFDAARYLSTPEAQAEYLSAMMEGNDPALIRHALGTIARAHGMAELARVAGLGPKSLYKALGEDGNPELGTVLKVLDAMGLRLGVQAAAGQSRPSKGDGASPQPVPVKRPHVLRRKGIRPSPANASPKPGRPKTREQVGQG